MQYISKLNYLSTRYEPHELPESQKYLGICRELLGLLPELPEQEDKTTHELMRELTGIDINICPVCKKGRMKIIAEIPGISGFSSGRSLIQPLINDSS